MADNEEVLDDKDTDKGESGSGSDKESTGGNKPEKAEEDEETIQSKKLFKALSNPKTAVPVLKILMEQHGLKLETKKDVEKAKDEVLDILENELGDEYKFLAPKLSNAFKKILGTHQEQIENRFKEQQASELQRESKATVKKLETEYKDWPKYEKRINELTDEIEIGENTSFEVYLRHLYRVAKSEDAESSTKDKLTNKLVRSRSDVSNKLTPHSGSDDKNRKTTPKSLRDIIAQTADEIEDSFEDE